MDENSGHSSDNKNGNKNNVSEDKWMQEEKRRRNRESAAKSRQRIRVTIDKSRETVAALEAKQIALRNEIALISKELEQAQLELNSHNMHCGSVKMVGNPLYYKLATSAINRNRRQNNCSSVHPSPQVYQQVSFDQPGPSYSKQLVQYNYGNCDQSKVITEQVNIPYVAQWVNNLPNQNSTLTGESTTTSPEQNNFHQNYQVQTQMDIGFRIGEKPMDTEEAAKDKEEEEDLIERFMNR